MSLDNAVTELRFRGNCAVVLRSILFTSHHLLNSSLIFSPPTSLRMRRIGPKTEIYVSSRAAITESEDSSFRGRNRPKMNRVPRQMISTRQLPSNIERSMATQSVKVLSRTSGMHVFGLGSGRPWLKHTRQVALTISTFSRSRVSTHPVTVKS